MKIVTIIITVFCGIISAFAQETVIKDRSGNTAGVANSGLLNSESAGTGVNITSLTGTVQTVKAAAGVVVSGQCTNEDTVWYYVQIFNVVSPSVGTTAPIQSIGLPPGSGSMVPRPVNFDTVIKVAATTTPTGSSAATAGKVNCNFVTR